MCKNLDKTSCEFAKTSSKIISSGLLELPLPLCAVAVPVYSKQYVVPVPVAKMKMAY